MASALTVAMVNHPVSILRREPRARILRHAHSHHRSLSAVSSALANITPPASPDRTTASDELDPPDVPDVASQIPGLFEQNPGLLEQIPGLLEQNFGMLEQNPGFLEQNPGLLEQNPDLLEQML